VNLILFYNSNPGKLQKQGVYPVISALISRGSSTTSSLIKVQILYTIYQSPFLTIGKLHFRIFRLFFSTNFNVYFIREKQKK
jgi:hypothetical protein